MPTQAHALGQEGEDAALHYLLNNRYELVQRNYRYRRAEIDLIVRWGSDLLVFVEVKARSSSNYGYPEEFVTERKRELMRLAADRVQEELGWTGDIRFDIIALIPSNAGLRIKHFEDAFS